ncbi:MAG: ATP synthase F1 subunit delta [Fibrobacterota bacterium]
MNATRVARRYAAALYKLAAEEGKLPEVTRDMALIAEACRLSPELLALVKNPVLTSDLKKASLDAVFAGSLLPRTRRFLAFLMEKKRLSFLPDMAAAFLAMDREARGVADAHMITAFPLLPETLQQLISGLQKKFNKRFEIRSTTDPSLLGGFELHIQDRVFDCSVSHQIQLLRKQLVGENG